jgi:hypothetical protein
MDQKDAKDAAVLLYQRLIKVPIPEGLSGAHILLAYARALAVAANLEYDPAFFGAIRELVSRFPKHK